MRPFQPARPRSAAGTQPAKLSKLYPLLLLVPALLLAGCTSQSRLTARATGCSTGDVTIVGSEFKREGVETAWCARCDGKLYQCATNADRTDVQCFEPREGSPCL